MEITLLTLSSNAYWPMMQLTAPNKLEYCLRWGIQLNINKMPDKEFRWAAREEQMMHALSNCDYLWFMGADTLIMNHTVNVRQFINPDIDFLIGQDFNGINNDVFFLKNSAASRVFLKDLLSKNAFYPDDQSAMYEILTTEKYLKFHAVHQKYFNSYVYDAYLNIEPRLTHMYYNDRETYDKSKFSNGDFILHVPGLPFQKRMEILTEYKNYVIKEK